MRVWSGNGDPRVRKVEASNRRRDCQICRRKQARQGASLQVVGITCTMATRNRFDRQVKVLADNPHFGIRLPKTVVEALKIGKSTDTDIWKRAVNKEPRPRSRSHNTAANSRMRRIRRDRMPYHHRWADVTWTRIRVTRNCP
jgi:hypothetical protein